MVSWAAPSTIFFRPFRLMFLDLEVSKSAEKGIASTVDLARMRG